MAYNALAPVKDPTPTPFLPFMARYADHIKLETLIETYDLAYNYVNSKEPALMHKWRTLRDRLGKACPLARSTLKAVSAAMPDDKLLIDSCNAGRWLGG